ncbi:MAG: toll/interleukin-1 receptor domain-containing protein [Kiritimatiellae bacterium]|nr:toll/interleukin-1 receptor domain-containing protein [Kiritimatiellia bacterium]
MSNDDVKNAEAAEKAKTDGTKEAVPYTYYAFISYSHYDEKWARWIQHALEHYHLPSVARKEIGREVKIRPVFRYQTDLGVSILRSQIPRELDQSKFLIVVCSPNSAKPGITGEHWVNDEIRHFIDAGRADRIIPVIVDGVPNGGNRECFPPALAALGVSGPNMKEEGKGVVLQKVVSRLLGLRPDILIDRWRKERRRKRLFSFLCLVPLLAVCCMGALLAWDATRTVSRYHADYVDNWGLPQGIFPVSPADVEQRFSTWRFDYRGYYWHRRGIHAQGLPKSLFGPRRKLVRVVRVNSRGVPKEASLLDDEETQWPQGARPAIQDFRNIPGEEGCWDDSGRLRQFYVRKRGGADFASGPVERTVKLSNRNPRRGSEGGETVINGYVTEYFGTTSSILYPATTLAQSGGLPRTIPCVPRIDIAKRMVERDESGRTTKMRFLNAKEEAATDVSSVGGFEYELDSLGRPRRIWNLGAKNGERAADLFGCTRFDVEYDGASVVSERFWSGSRIGMGRGGFSEADRFCDEWGNTTNFVVRGSDGSPVLKKPSVLSAQLPPPWNVLSTLQYTECVNLYDDGEVVSKCPLGFTYKIVHFGYTESGDICHVYTQLNWLEKGLSIWYEVDPETGYMLSQKTFLDGVPASLPAFDGVAEFRFEVDGYGNWLRVERRDAKGRLTSGNQNGTCIDINVFENGRLVKQSFYDGETNACSQTGTPEGVTVGCWTHEYGANPDNLKYMWAWTDSSCAKRAYYDGKICGMELAYDARGRIVECWNIDEKKNHVASPRTGWAGKKWDYSSVERDSMVISGFTMKNGWTECIETFRNADGWAVTNVFGPRIARRRSIIAPRLVPMMTCVEDENGDLAELEAGCRMLRRNLDETGESYELFRYDAKGALATNAFGIAGMRVKCWYEDKGRRTVATFTWLGQDGNPKKLDFLGFSSLHTCMSGGISDWSFWDGDTPCENAQLGHVHRMVRIGEKIESSQDKDGHDVEVLPEMQTIALPDEVNLIRFGFWSGSEWAVGLIP